MVYNERGEKLKKKILAIGVVSIFLLLGCSSISVVGKEAGEQKQLDQTTETYGLSEPDYKFDNVEIELHGKAIGWSISGTYARWWKFRIPFTDYEYSISHCFKFWVEEKIPGYQLELIEGYFDITTPSGETSKVEYDGDTCIEFVSKFAKQSRYDPDEPYYYFKGTLKQGVEIYL